jgi:hypothetical protein
MNEAMVPAGAKFGRAFAGSELNVTSFSWTSRTCGLTLKKGLDGSVL